MSKVTFLLSWPKRSPILLTSAIVNFGLLKSHVTFECLRECIGIIGTFALSAHSFILRLIEDSPTGEESNNKKLFAIRN